MLTANEAAENLMFNLGLFYETPWALRKNLMHDWDFGRSVA